MVEESWRKHELLLGPRARIAPMVDVRRPHLKAKFQNRKPNPKPLDFSDSGLLTADDTNGGSQTMGRQP